MSRYLTARKLFDAITEWAEYESYGRGGDDPTSQNTEHWKTVGAAVEALVLQFPDDPILVGAHRAYEEVVKSALERRAYASIVDTILKGAEANARQSPSADNDGDGSGGPQGGDGGR